MNRIIFFCLLVAGLCLHKTTSAQCTADPNCTPAQLICPTTLPNGCAGQPYSSTITISLGATIASFPLNDITLDSITGLPPGFTFSCTPSDCIFPANTNSCVQITGPAGAPAGTYTLRGFLQVDVGFVIPIDTPLGAIIIDALDCNGDCGGTATIDACGICSGGNTGVLPNCDDADACTTDDCDGTGGCLYDVVNCDDLNPCTSDTCINGGCENTSTLTNTEHIVTLTGMDFTPDSLSITTGDTVVWNNVDGFHSVNGSTAQFPTNPASFSSGAPANAPWTYSFVFTVSGEYDYWCDAHGNLMTGNIVVSDPVVDCAGVCGGTASIDSCGVCSGGTTGLLPNCDDGDPCTTDDCDGANGCINTPLNCDDLNVCTSDLCVNGTCEYTSVKPVLAFDFQNICEGDTTFITNLSTGVDAGATYSLDLYSDGSIDLTLPASALPADSALFVPITGNISFTVYVVNSTGCGDTLTGSILVADCDDANACTTDSCSEAQCFNTPIVCDDLDACTDNDCDVITGCVYTPIVCDDQDSCTTDLCVLGVCTFDSIPGCGSGNPCDTIVCNDGDSCTLDECNFGLCVFTPISCDDQDACTDDSCAGGLCINTPVSCDDADSCTIDECILGVCENTAIDCNDQDSCTIDACAGGICVNTPINCDDQDACTIDSCVGGLCVNALILCDDQELCTLDSCVNGVCEFPAIICNDNDSCTTDACVNGGCEFTPVVCDDADGCTNDACINGSCQYVPVVCDDSDACTTDSCIAGSCNFAPVICNDSDSCTLDACINGACEFTPVSCDDQDSCTVDICQGGQCLNIPVDCSDGDPCTDDLCVNGVCQHVAINCDDGDACTIDLCINGSCFHTPADCDDANPCTNDFCDTSGACQNITIPGCCQSNANCDDVNACTNDICNGGLCLYIATCCDDLDLCTIDVCDTTGACQFVPIFCSDGDLCTTDGCDTGVCTFTPVNCDDNDLCTADSCVSGTCIHTPQNCDDGDQCTTDFCDSTGTCQHIDMLCDDADLCTSDSCVQGVCVYTPMTCDDSDLCTVDKCVLGSCVFTNIDCADTLVCTEDYCIGGICFHDAILNCCTDVAQCDDTDPCTVDACTNNLCTHISTFTDLTITQTNLPSFCQGAGVILNAVSTSATTYAWSTTETTTSIQVVASGTYTVTATDSNGCEAIDSFTVTLDPSALLSSYVVVAQKDVDLSLNTVSSGGIGVIRDQGKVKVKSNTVITAAGTFVKSDIISISGGSTVTTTLSSEAALTLPPFETNPTCGQGADVFVAANSTVTLNGSQYKGITVQTGGTVTFTSATIDLENFFTKNNVTVNFTAPCVKIRVCKRFQLGANNSFNATNPSDVIAYVGQDVTIGGGTTLVSDIYMNSNKFTVQSATANDPTELTGLFIANMLQAGNNTIWHQNPACDPACNAAQPVVPCQSSDRRVVSFTLVNANTDQDIGPLTNGMVIDICQTPVNIRANVCDEANIESVRYLVNGNNYRMENLPFYTIAGDNNGNYLPWSIAPGTYTIRAIPFAGNNGTGTVGTDLSVTIQIVCTAPRLSNPNQTMGTDMIDRSVMLKGYPSVFSDKLNIEFSLPQDGKVMLDIIDVAGNKIAELFNGVAEGERQYKVEFEAGNQTGGMVIYRLQTESGVYYNKAVLVKD